jgi:hypothetical protein
MRKDSTIIGLSTVLLTAAIIGGVWYMANRPLAEPPAPEAATWTTLEPEAVGGAKSVPGVPAGTSSGRAGQVIECELPDGTKGYTNAASCEEADFENRLTIADPLVPLPKRQRYSGEDYQSPAQQAKSARDSSPTAKKPSLALIGKPPPSGLNPSCTFAVGKALEIERDLSAADNPMESIWRENYCRWRCDAVERKCGVPDSYFYYRYNRLCPHENWNGC